MSINIVDNFNLGTSKPIDGRVIATNSTARNAITYKYDGLKVFQTDNRVTYTWNATSSTWNSDVMTNGYIPKYTTSGMTDSCIYVTSSNVGINTIISSSASLPHGVLQLNRPNSDSSPLLMDVKGSATIAYNWYDDDNGEHLFNSYDGDYYGCSAIRFDGNGSIKFNAFYDTPTTPLVTTGTDYSMIIDPKGADLPGPGVGINTDLYITYNSGSTYIPIIDADGKWGSNEFIVIYANNDAAAAIAGVSVGGIYFNNTTHSLHTRMS